MAKTILGIDIGCDTLKLALVSGRHVKKSVVVPMPVGLFKEGRVVSTETMGELLRKTMKEYGIHANYAAVTFPNDVAFIRTVTLPQMTHEQLLTNLPYEFRDYISDELKNYYFDYAVIDNQKILPDDEEEEEQSAPTYGFAQESPEQQKEEKPPKLAMELLAVAVPVSLMTETREFLRKAGLRLVGAAPAVSSYISLIRALPVRHGKVLLETPDSAMLEPPTFRSDREYCILDLGYRSVRMYIFRGDVHIVTKILEVGMSTLDDVIAEAYNVDIHLAHTYLLTDYQGCQENPVCINAYNNIALELMRAVNFYKFSNRESVLTEVWLSGGGANIAPLRKAVAGTLMMNVRSALELVPGGDSVDNCDTLVQAIGIADVR